MFSNECFLEGKLNTLNFMQMFDKYNNHVAEGTNVLVCTDGLCIQDSLGLNRKVREAYLSTFSLKENRPIFCMDLMDILVKCSTIPYFKFNLVLFTL